jgi:hypothetical protein
VLMLEEYPPPILLEHSSFVARFIASHDGAHFMGDEMKALFLDEVVVRY